MKRQIFILSLLVCSVVSAKTKLEDEILPFPPAGAKAKPKAQLYSEKCPGVNVEPVEAGNLPACRAAEGAVENETEAYVWGVRGPRKTITQGSAVEVTSLSDNTTPSALRPAIDYDNSKQSKEGTGNQ